jgi:hypothetical protein
VKRFWQAGSSRNSNESASKGTRPIRWLQVPVHPCNHAIAQVHLVSIAAGIGVAQRGAALGTAIMHAKAKPLSNLQIKIMIGTAKRLGLTRAPAGNRKVSDSL